MRGFLDPEYPTRVATDYRSVIDRVVVGLRPTAGYSFGAAIREIEPTLATLGSRTFYSDRDTRLEDVLTRVGQDTAFSQAYLVIGDGRRGSPDLANGQFVRMRALADRWIGAGGSFLVATSMAPFRTVQSDPSGCRQGEGEDASGQTCPLYAFAFIPPGASLGVASALVPAFEHIFVWPALPVEPDAVTLEADGQRPDVRLERQWQRTSAGTPIVRVRGPQPTQQWLTARVTLRDTTTPEAKAVLASLAGQGTRLILRSRRFAPEAASRSWQQSATGAATLVRPTPERPLSVDVVTRGAQGTPSAFRVDVVPNGEPSWLSSFDAEDASDRLRTYGIGRLFESFRKRAADQSATDTGAIARFFLVAN